jgi:hypothetical protein
MRDTDLFGMALGIEPPWLVKKSEFDATAKRLAGNGAVGAVG